MVITITPEDCARDRTPLYGGRVVELFGDRSRPWDGPCGHLVHQRASDDNPTHFHEADQFQIFVAGSGSLGGHAVKPGFIHYADGYRAYGPIVADERGCSYVTLRPSFDTSHHMVSESAALARGRKGGQKIGQVDLSPAAMPGLKTIFFRDDGVAAYQQVVSAGESVEPVEVKGGSFGLILKGEAWIDGRLCSEGSCVWVGEGEACPPMMAGKDGLVLALLCCASAEAQAGRNPSFAD